MVTPGAARHCDRGLGSGLSMSNVVLVGARDLDPHEKQLIASGVLTYVVGRMKRRASARPSSCAPLEPRGLRSPARPR
jgi:hypothetical protein